MNKNDKQKFKDLIKLKNAKALALAKSADGNEVFLNTQEEIELKKDATGVTVDNTRDIHTIVTEAVKDLYPYVDVEFYDSLAKKYVGNVTNIKSPFYTSPDIEPEATIGVEHGERAGLSIPGTGTKDVEFFTIGNEARIIKEAILGTEADLEAIVTEKCFQSFMKKFSKALLVANTKAIGVPVIESATAGTDGELTAGTYKVRVVQLNARATSLYKNKTLKRVQMLSKVTVKFPAGQAAEQRNNGLSAFSDETEVVVAANGSITVNVAFNHAAYMNAIFVNGSLQALVSTNRAKITKIVAGTQLLNTLIDEDCSTEENIFKGALQLISNSETPQFTTVLENGAGLVEGAKGRIAAVDEILERVVDEYEVEFDELRMSPKVFKKFDEIMTKDVISVVNVSSQTGEISTRDVVKYYSHPSNPDKKLKLVVMNNLPDVILFWSNSMSTSYQNVENPMQIVIREDVHLEHFAVVKRVVESGWYASVALDCPLPFHFHVLRNITL